MKKHIILILSTIFISIIAKAQEKSCMQKMHKGVFTYTTTHGTPVWIVRHKNRQVEISNNGKSKLITSIRWVNDSTYILKFKREKNDPGCLLKGTEINCVIINCDGNAYSVRSNSEPCGEAINTMNWVSKNHLFRRPYK